MTDEESLIKQAQQNPEYFRLLYRRYFPRVYAYIAYRVRRVQDAEDITADVFMKVAQNFAQFEYRGEGSFTAWMFRIAHNTVMQFHRHNDVALIPIEDLPEIADHVLLPDQALQRKEQFAHLSAMIALLPNRRREVVTLRFFGGLRNNEIAEVLQLDERTVAAHLSRALQDLRQLVEQEKHDENAPTPP